MTSNATNSEASLLIGVLALQGAFEEHQHIIHHLGHRTVQVKTPVQLQNLSGIIFPGGESTAMGLIGSGAMWTALKKFVDSGKPTWGTCAGMVLLAERCVGGSAVIENGQSLIGGMDVLVCRNYFGSQVSSFEMKTPCPPTNYTNDDDSDFPGVFIRAPAILTAAEDIDILGKVVATPCRQAAKVLEELDKKLAAGENVVMMRVVDALERDSNKKIKHNSEKRECSNSSFHEEKKEDAMDVGKITLPGAAKGTNAREVICAIRKNNVLCTAFHPELTHDYRWHQYFIDMVKSSA